MCTRAPPAPSQVQSRPRERTPMPAAAPKAPPMSGPKTIAGACEAGAGRCFGFRCSRVCLCPVFWGVVCVCVFVCVRARAVVGRQGRGRQAASGLTSGGRGVTWPGVGALGEKGERAPSAGAGVGASATDVTPLPANSRRLLKRDLRTRRRRRSPHTFRPLTRCRPHAHIRTETSAKARPIGRSGRAIATAINSSRLS